MTLKIDSSLSPEKQIYEILILGGGPSGLSTALHLHKFASKGTRVLVLEKEHYPRHKLCAGGLVGDAEVILERLGLDVREIPHVDASAAHFDFAAKGLTVRLPKSHTIRVIRRDELDTWLAGKTREAGIEIREGVIVRNIIPDSQGVIVETDSQAYHAKIVVGADGSNGITRRIVFPNAPVYTARVLEVITPTYPDPHRSPGTSSKSIGFGGGREGAAYFDFFPVPNNIAGYVWDFPTQVNGQPMRCWGIYDTNLLAGEDRPPLKEPLAEEMSRLGLNLSDFEIKGYPIRWFHPSNPFSAPHILLVGDAAGADPLFGEGISMALGYGNLAARAIVEALKKNDFSFHTYKRGVLLSPLGQTLMARWMIARVLYAIKWKWFQILIWRIMKPFVILGAWVFVLNWGKRMR